MHPPSSPRCPKPLRHLKRRPFSLLLLLLSLLSPEHPSKIFGRLFCWVGWITRFFPVVDVYGLDGTNNGQLPFGLPIPLQPTIQEGEALLLHLQEQVARTGGLKKDIVNKLHIQPMRNT
jgi:hypothetical protein